MRKNRSLKNAMQIQRALLEVEETHQEKLIAHKFANDLFNSINPLLIIAFPPERVDNKTEEICERAENFLQCRNGDFL